MALQNLTTNAVQTYLFNSYTIGGIYVTRSHRRIFRRLPFKREREKTKITATCCAVEYFSRFDRAFAPPDERCHVVTRRPIRHFSPVNDIAVLDNRVCAVAIVPRARVPLTSGREAQGLWSNPKPEPGNPGSGLILRVRRRLWLK